MSKKRSKDEKSLMQQYKEQIRKETIELPKNGPNSEEYKKIQAKTDEIGNLLSEKFGITRKQFEKIIKKVSQETIQDVGESHNPEYIQNQEFMADKHNFNQFVKNDSMPLAKIALDAKTKIKERSPKVRDLQREAIRLTRKMYKLEQKACQEPASGTPFVAQWADPKIVVSLDELKKRRNEIRKEIGEGAWKEVRMQNIIESYNKEVKRNKSSKPIRKDLIKA